MATEDFHDLVISIANRHKDIPEFKTLSSSPLAVKVTPLTGGSVNYLLHVTSGGGDTNLVFKHASPTGKDFPEFPLSQSRISVEYHTLEMVNAFRPGSTPRLLCLDEESHTAVMEFVKDAETLSEMLSRGIVDLDVARSVGEVMADLHKNTWCSSLSEEHLDRLVQLYRTGGRPLVENKENFDFVQCLPVDSPFNHIEEELMPVYVELTRDGSLEQLVEQLRAHSYDHWATSRQCVVHNDLHTASVLVKGKQIKMIDAEFADVSIAGKDVGNMVAFYVMFYYKAHYGSHMDQANILLEAIREMVQVYLESMAQVLNSSETRKTMLEDITQFTGLCLFRFTHFADLGLHVDLPPSVKVMCWRTGKALMESATKVKEMEDFIQLIARETQNNV